MVSKIFCYNKKNVAISRTCFSVGSKRRHEKISKEEEVFHPERYMGSFVQLDPLYEKLYETPW